MKFYIISPLTPCGDIVHLITAPSGQCCGGLAVTMRMVQNPPWGLSIPVGSSRCRPHVPGQQSRVLAGSGTALYRGASRAPGPSEVRHNKTLLGLMLGCSLGLQLVKVRLQAPHALR